MIFFCRGLFDFSGLNHKHFLAEVCWEFSEFEISCSTSPPGGNQVDGLPPDFSCRVKGQITDRKISVKSEKFEKNEFFQCFVKIKSKFAIKSSIAK